MRAFLRRRYNGIERRKLMDTNRRVVMDCRSQKESKGCTLTISGSEDEVLDIAQYHAVKRHGLNNDPNLREHLKQSLKEEAYSR
jgi:hypothetical protein